MPTNKAKKVSADTPGKSDWNKKAFARKNTAGTKKLPSESRAVCRRREAVPIVGIGASAGGLEALEAFFNAMPPDAGIAFVLVAHLDPTHISILPELLQKHTKMPVLQIRDGMQVEPNHVYVIPPNKDLTILHATLQLMELRQPRGANLPIDIFLPLAGPGPGSKRGLHHPFRHGHRRHAGREGDQGRSRHGHGPGRGVGQVRRDAPQRHRHGAGRLCAAAGRRCPRS